ncbi:hypothetical protein PYCCODRAFT_1473738, partial [Trametes coccinea BRFM310]
MSRPLERRRSLNQASWYTPTPFQSDNESEAADAFVHTADDRDHSERRDPVAAPGRANEARIARGVSHVWQIIRAGISSLRANGRVLKAHPSLPARKAMARPLPPISLPIQNVAAFPPLDMSMDQAMAGYPAFAPPRQPASGPVRTVRPPTRQTTAPRANPTRGADYMRNAVLAPPIAAKPLPPIPAPPLNERYAPLASSSRLDSVPRRMALPHVEIDTHFASSSTSHASGSQRAPYLPRRLAPAKRTPALTITPPTPIYLPPEPMFTIPSFRSTSPSPSPRRFEPPAPSIPPSPLALDMPVFIPPARPPIRRRRTESSLADDDSAYSVTSSVAGPSKRAARRR